METNQQWARTQSEKHNLNFTWTIDNYSYRQMKNGKNLRSPIFSIDINDPICWFLELYPRGKDKDSTDYISIFLKPKCGGEYPKVTGKFKLSILNAAPNKNNKSELLEFTEIYYDVSWGFRFFYNRSSLMNEANGFLPEDKLTIFCEINFILDNIVISSQNYSGEFKVPECSRITNDLAKLLDSQEFSDVTFVVGEHEFPAHKAILAARSDVFAAMFKHEMEERKSGRVNITDISQEVFREILHFLYTEEAPKLKGMANHLLAAADKYALKILKFMSEKALFEELSIESAAETLILADLHSAEQLKEQTKHFISNHAKEFLKTKGCQMINVNENDYSTLIEETLKVLIK